MLTARRNRLGPLASALSGLLLALGLGDACALEFNQVQAAQSKLSFVSRQMGVPVAGTFPRFTATLRFDPAQPTQAAARIEIDLASIDAGSQEANDEVVGKQWLNVKTYPSAQFVATSVAAHGDKGYEALGQLTIKGKTRDLTAPFSFRQEGNTGVFDGSFVIKRLDFGIGEGTWSDVSTVANEIEIKFHILAAGSAPAGK